MGRTGVVRPEVDAAARDMKAGSSNLLSDMDGQLLSLLFCLCLSFFFLFSLSCSFSRALVSRMTCWAGVSGSFGSFVGVSLLFAVAHQLLSFCDDGDGGVAGGIVWEREGGGGSELGDPPSTPLSMSMTRCSTVRRSSASWRIIRSASRLLRSRCRSASASSSSSVGRSFVRDPGLTPFTSEPTRCAMLAANLATEGDGECERVHGLPSCDPSEWWMEPSSDSLISPVSGSMVVVFLSGDGGRRWP